MKIVLRVPLSFLYMGTSRENTQMLQPEQEEQIALKM